MSSREKDVKDIPIKSSCRRMQDSQRDSFHHRFRREGDGRTGKQDPFSILIRVRQESTLLGFLKNMSSDDPSSDQ
jgi:hypothetical protein